MMVVQCDNPDFNTVTVASQVMASTMSPGNLYVYSSTTDSWIALGTVDASPTAAKSAGSRFVPAKTEVLLNGHYGTKIAVLRDTVDGNATLTPVKSVLY